MSSGHMQTKRPPAPDVSSIDKAILRIAAPAFATLLTEPTYLLVDTAIVGMIGSTSLAALAVANTILAFCFAIFVFLTFNTAAFVATSIGAGDHRRAADVTVDSLWLALLLGFAAGAITILVGPTLVRALVSETADGTHLRVVEQAITYLRISALGFPFLMLTMAASGALRGRRNTKAPLWAAAIATVANIVIEVVAVLVLDLGVAGSAAATVIAPGLGTVFILRRLHPHIAGVASSLRPNLAAMRSQARAGGGLVVRTILLRGIFIATVWLAGRAGVVPLAGYQVAIGVFTFLVFGLDAIEAAAQVLVAESIGALDPTLARLTTLRLLRSAAALGTVLGLVTIVSAKWIPQIFTSDPDVASAATMGLIGVGAMMPVCGVAFAVDGIVVAGARTSWLAAIMAVSVIGFALICFGIESMTDQPLSLGWIVICLGLFMTIRAGAGLWMVRRARWASTWASGTATDVIGVPG